MNQKQVKLYFYFILDKNPYENSNIHNNDNTYDKQSKKEIKSQRMFRITKKDSRINLDRILIPHKDKISKIENSLPKWEEVNQLLQSGNFTEATHAYVEPENFQESRRFFYKDPEDIDEDL